MAESANFLAVDLGASSGRVLLGTLTGERFELRELHRFANGPVRVRTSLYWNPLELWSQIQNALSKYARDATAPLEGVGVDTWGVDFALLDGRGDLLGNPHHYRDARTDGLIERVFEHVPKAELYRRTGLQFMQINTLYQLYSVRESPQLAAAETLLMMPDLFHYWLTGEAVGETTVASTSQLLNAQTRLWDTELLETLGLPSHILPPLVPPGTVLGTLRPSVAKDTQLSPDTLVIAPASHDTASAFAAISGGGMFISSGTWSLVGTEIAEPILTPEALALDFTNESGIGDGNRGSVRLLKNVAGLWLLQECRKQWAAAGHDATWEELLALGEQAPAFRSLIDPGAETFLNPDSMPDAICTFCREHGEPEPHTTGELVRCCLESLALKYRSVLDDLESLTGTRMDVVRIVGGGSQNALLCQYTADACRRPVVAGPAEATALGNLMMQALARGFLPDLGAARAVASASGQQTNYEPQNGEAWAEAYGRFRGLLQRS